MLHSLRRKANANNDERREKRRDGALGQRGEAGEKVNVVEPELGAGFVPGVPAQQTDGQRGGHLHIGGSAARKAHDAGAGHRNQRRIQMPARPESSHMQVDERHHDEGKGGGGKAGAPVVHTEVLKEEHGAPIIECRLLQPGTAVEIRRDAGIQAALDERMRRIEMHQHLVRDLGVARLVCAHQAHSVAAQNGGQSVKKEKDGEGKKDRRFNEDGPARHAPAPSCGSIRSRTVPRDFPSLPIFDDHFLRSAQQHASFRRGLPIDAGRMGVGPANHRAATGADTMQYFDRDKANRFPRVLKFASGPGHS